MNEQVKAKLQQEIQDLRDRLQQAEAELRAFSPDTVETVEFEPPETGNIRRDNPFLLQAILDNTTDLMAALDLNWRYIAFNQAYKTEFIKIFGGEIDRGTSLIAALAHLPQEQANAQEIWGQALRGEEFTVIQEFGDSRRDRNKYQLIFHSIRDDQGQILGALHIVKNLSQIERQTQQSIQAQVALQESEERFRNAFDYAGIGMALVDLDGRFMKVNHSLCQMIGYSESELLSRTFHEITHPDDLDADVAWAKQLLAGEIRFYQLEKRYIHKQGQIIWILLTGSLVRDSQNQPLYFIAQMQDISDRQSTEEKLRQHQQHLQYLLTSSPAVIFSTQPESNYKLTYISDNVVNVLGYIPEQFLKGSDFWLNHIHPEDINLILQELPRKLNQGNYSFEYRFLHADRTYHWLLDEGRLIRDEKGEPIEVVGYFVDISDRKQAEFALSRSRELKEAIFNESTDALFLVDPETGLTIDCNQFAVELFEAASENELIHIEGHTLQKSRFTSEELAKINQVINQYGVWSKEVEYITKKGKHFWGNLAVKRIHLADTAINLVRVTDITVRKQTEKDLKLQAVITRNMAEGICLVRATDGIIVYANPKFEQMFGYEPGELNNQPVKIVNYKDNGIDADQVRQLISQKIMEHGEYTYKIHNVKKDGTPFWCQATTSRFEHPDYGTVLVAVQQDITVQKQTQDQLKASLKEKEVLLKEIHHRVKNNLQIVSSLLQMQSRRTKDQDVALVLQDSQNRIASIALVHEKLYRSENLAQIDFAQYVPDLITHLFDSYNISSNRVRISYQVEDIPLAIDTAIPCGLILNELVSNTLKYAFPEHKNGEIEMAESLTGWQLAEARDRKLTEVFNIIDENTRQPVGDVLTNVLEQETIIHLEEQILLIPKQGKTIPVADSIAPIKNNNGAITGAVLVFRDATQQRLAQEQNRALERARQLEYDIAELQCLELIHDNSLNAASLELPTSPAKIKLAVRILETILDQQSLLSSKISRNRFGIDSGENVNASTPGRD
ncbi:PAS domain S-box protein [Coleofasciculus sp.]|uniref:PAS domain S-box protein n=1 Tax=Coleofasciculus sp. TaxID=3100458 RepID=UPI003A1C7CA5